MSALALATISADRSAAVSGLFAKDSAIVVARSAALLVRAAASFAARSASVAASFAEGLINASVTLSTHAVISLDGASSVFGKVYSPPLVGVSQNAALVSINISVLPCGASLVFSVRK